MHESTHEREEANFSASARHECFQRHVGNGSEGCLSSLHVSSASFFILNQTVLQALRKWRTFSRRKITHRANDRIINYICVRVCLCAQIIHKHHLSWKSFQQCPRANLWDRYRWCKSEDISFQTESQKHLGATQSLAQSCKAFWQFFDGFLDACYLLGIMYSWS